MTSAARVRPTGTHRKDAASAPDALPEALLAPLGRRVPVVAGPLRVRPGRIDVVVWTRRGRRTVSFSGVDCPPEAAGDVLVPVTGRLAMSQQRPALVLSSAGTATIRSFHARAQHLAALRGVPPPPPVRAPRRREPLGPPPVGRAIAAMFTGGLDSFHTVLREPGRVGALVYVHGFDIAPSENAQRRLVLPRVRAAADALGLELHEVHTDLRRWSNHRIHWGEYVNAGIDAVALALAGRFSALWFSASVTDTALPGGMAQAPPGGNEWIRIERRDGDLTRPAKMAAVIGHPVVRDHLRVCWHNTGAYNCGTCEKCVRTKVNLAAVGALDACTSLPGGLDAEAVRRLPNRARSQRAFLAENLDAARQHGEHRLAQLLEERLGTAGLEDPL